MPKQPLPPKTETEIRLLLFYWISVLLCGSVLLKDKAGYVVHFPLCQIPLTEQKQQ